MSLAIETEHLVRRFGAHTVVDQVSLRVPSRSVYGFLGRNGAGKTTTFKLLLGLLRPDAGQVRIGGIDVVRQRIAALRQVGALLEAQGFYPHLKGREQLDLQRRLLGLPASEVDRVLELTEMQAHGGRTIGDYSLGMRQRLGLARALLGAPSVLILDEPTNGLDPEGMADMRGFLRSLPERSGATVLLSSHLLGEIEQIASHIGMLCEGRLVLQGRLEDLQAEQDGAVLFGTDAAAAAIDLARGLGIPADPCDGGMLARFALDQPIEAASAALNHQLCTAGIAVHTVAPQRRSLEAVYRRASQALSSTSNIALA
ncbi:ABC transporter ATP-binding protein [Pseudomarimonas arenosa]|uniref:ABC transporter ATP-binding protein n=1 Tax=Pseudomarimonas arenosa TaxID=2774145 RepID=A0AAW3ZL79_9GAMM|nr:ABC transporter ATP-binding protein [Pseudomarimonas arenosa]MBD8526893.1 ABC transporter ATP-binding protein [Pseudomarimonas arenosa]